MSIDHGLIPNSFKDAANSKTKQARIHQEFAHNIISYLTLSNAKSIISFIKGITTTIKAISILSFRSILLNLKSIAWNFESISLNLTANSSLSSKFDIFKSLAVTNSKESKGPRNNLVSFMASSSEWPLFRSSSYVSIWLISISPIRRMYILISRYLNSNRSELIFNSFLYTKPSLSSFRTQICNYTQQGFFYGA